VKKMIAADWPNALKDLTELVAAGEDVTLTRNDKALSGVSAAAERENEPSIGPALKGTSLMI